MSRAALFKLSDVRRAVKAAEGCGLSVAGVEVGPDGTIRVLTGKVSLVQGVDDFEAWEAANGLRAA